MIGILYYIKSNEYLTYHPLRGFYVVENYDNLDKNIIWISNLKESSYSYIKNEDFFNIKFKEIIYYYNLNHLEAPEQLKEISKFFNMIIDIFKEEYSFFNFKVEILKDINDFSEILFKSKFNLPKIADISFIKSSFNKEVEISDVNKIRFFISYFQTFEFVKNIFDIYIPYGDFEIINVDNFSKHKNPFVIMDLIPKEKKFLIKCKNDNQQIINKFFPEKSDNAWFSDIELKWLHNKCSLTATEILIFKDKIRLRELMRTRLKTQYFNFPYSVFTFNLIKSIKNNNIEIINLWIDSYEKIFYLDKINNLIENDIDVAYLNGSKIIIGVEEVSAIKTLEQNALMYPIKLISYIINK